MLSSLAGALAWSILSHLALADDAIITAGPTHARRVRKDTLPWGFISGNSNSALSCQSGYTYSAVGVAHNFVGCCNDVECTNAYRTCIPYMNTACADTSICSLIYTQVLYCGASAPGCTSYVRVASPQATSGITSYACGPSDKSVRVLSTPTATAMTDTQNNVTPGSTFTTAVSPGGKATVDQPTATDTTAGTGNTASAPSTAKKDPLSEGGNIAGIVSAIVGFVALVALLIFGIRDWNHNPNGPVRRFLQYIEIRG